MDDNLLENSHLETYNSTNNFLDNICPVCLDPLHGVPILPTQSENCSDLDSCDSTEFIDIELVSQNNSRENSNSFYWTCHNCSNTYHLKCIYDWAKNKTTFDCPTCRHSHTLDIDVVETYDIANVPSYLCCNNCPKPLLYAVSFIAASLLGIFILEFLFPNLLNE